MSAGESFVLAANQGATTNGSAKVVMGGKYALGVEGTLGAASFLQTLHPSGNWATLGSAITVDTIVDVPPGQVRFITGSGASAVYAYLTRVPENIN